MNEPKKAVNLTLPRTLLEKIEADISGKNRSEKITKCCETGYRSLMEG